MLEKQIVMAFIAVLVLIGIDVLLGIFVGLKAGKFDVRVLPQFLQTAVVPYVGGLVVLLAGSYFVPEVKAAFAATIAALTLKYIADVNDKLKLLFGKALPEPMRSK